MKKFTFMFLLFSFSCDEPNNCRDAGCDSGLVDSGIIDTGVDSDPDTDSCIDEELCDDIIDNDCDGLINENCPGEDTDTYWPDAGMKDSGVDA